MEDIATRVKKLLEDAEPGMTVVVVSGTGEAFDCPIGEALWLEYRRLNPNGLTIPPSQRHNIINLELLPYFNHVGGCDDCYVV